jgi:hypothetical protein
VHKRTPGSEGAACAIVFERLLSKAFSPVKSGVRRSNNASRKAALAIRREAMKEWHAPHVRSRWKRCQMIRVYSSKPDKYLSGMLYLDYENSLQLLWRGSSQWGFLCVGSGISITSVFEM